MAQTSTRCLNHPERTAVARCKQCHKPLCERCVKKMPGGVYCSDECYQKMGDFQDRVKDLDEQRGRRTPLGKLVKWAIILAVVVAILYFVFVAQGVRSFGDFIGMIKGLIP